MREMSAAVSERGAGGDGPSTSVGAESGLAGLASARHKAEACGCSCACYVRRDLESEKENLVVDAVDGEQSRE